MSEWMLGERFELMRRSVRGRPLGRSPTVGKEVQPSYSHNIHTQYQTQIFVLCQSMFDLQNSSQSQHSARYSFPIITKPTRQSQLNHLLQQTN